MRLCADLGGSFVDVAIVTDDAAILHRRKYPTPADWRTLAGIFGDLQDEHRALLRPGDPIAIATAGLVDPDTGVVTAANVACVHGRALAQDLGAAIGRPVTVVNDADAFVLAEAGLGIARGHTRVFGIILGTGVGGALIEDGRIVTGGGGIAGEWGHGQVMVRSPLAPDAMPVFACGCGRSGCLDTIGGARGLERLHHFLHGTRTGSHEIIAAWVRGVPEAVATIDFYCDIVAGPLAMLLNCVPATVVPVGGGLSAATGLVAELDRRVRAGLLRPTAAPMLRPGALGGDAGVLGAFLAVAAHTSAGASRDR